MLRSKYSVEDLRALRDVYLADLQRMLGMLNKAEIVNPRSLSAVGIKLEMLDNIAIQTQEPISLELYAGLIQSYTVSKTDLEHLEKTLKYPATATLEDLCESFVTAAEWGRLKDLRSLMQYLQFVGCPVVALNDTLLEARRLTLVTDEAVVQYLDRCLQEQTDRVGLASIGYAATIRFSQTPPGFVAQLPSITTIPTARNSFGTSV